MSTIKDGSLAQRYPSVLIRFHSFENNDMSGKFYCTNSPEGISFFNLTHMILTINDLINNLTSSKNTENSLNSEKCSENDSVTSNSSETNKEHLKEEVIAVFKLDIRFRQNSDWQGQISWLDKNKEIPFRSVLELIIILNEALISEKVNNEKANNKS